MGHLLPATSAPSSPRRITTVAPVDSSYETDWPGRVLDLAPFECHSHRQLLVTGIPSISSTFHSSTE
jgi:hypothetical protein